MSDQAKDTARRLYAAMDRHDVEGFVELLAKDVVNRGTSSQGREASGRELAYWLGAFPDLSVEVEHLICEGDLVAARYTGRGTHNGPLGAIVATGREVAVDQVDILRVKDGHIVEGWYLPDLYAMFRQLGVLGDVLAGEKPAEHAPA